MNENHFVDETNKIIFSTIKNLLDKNILVSPITLKNYLPEDKSTWQSEFSKSLYRETPSVIYFGETFEDLSPQFIENSVARINSPLTDELKSLPEYNAEIYCKAVLFLVNYINFKEKSLSRLDQLGAWDYISKKYSNATERVIKACTFKQV